MINGWFIAAALLLAPSPAYAQTAAFDTVDVAPPTGEQNIDRASILAALDQVEPGGTIRFAPGTYLIGEIIHVTVPGITVLGHPDGTTLRGCHPDMFPQQAGWEEMFVAVVNCNGLDMAGGHQTVRGLTFEYAWHALVLGGMECIEGRGCVPVLQPVESRPGGYRVEDNTFRSTANGVRTLGQWSEPAVIRSNRFINTFHAVVVHGSIVHVVENDISVPEPQRVPSTGHPGVAMSVSATDLNLEAVLLCAGNVIAGNRISGHPDGIAIRLFRAGVSCRGNVIRGNTVAVERVKVPASWEITLTESDSSVVGVPIALINEPKADPEVFGSAAIDEQEGMLEGNLIEGNTISGAEGIGIELVHASGNRIVSNTIASVARRDPFPGITMNSFDPQKSGWREANGSGIWVSPGSDENEILDNTFDDIASHAIVLAGDHNHVELQSADDTVRDHGSNNRVVRSDGQAGAEAPRQDSVVSWLADRAIPILGVEAGSGFEDLQPLKEVLRGVRVIGLGESTHGTHEFFRFKHRLFEFMVREMGVRILAFEGSQSAAENVVDPYVQGGAGDIESVVASLGLVGGWEEVRDLVAWMRAYNQAVPASERVQFVGFDIQYNDEARRVVLEYLRRVAPQRVAAAQDLFQVPVDSLVYVPYLSRDTAEVRTAADVAGSALSRYRDLYEFVQANEERFARRTSEAEAEHLLRHMRVLYQFADVYGSLLAGSEAFNLLRDRYMAENLQRMLDAQPPDARLAVWAHNLHLMADSSLWSPRPMGRHLRETHGSAYYALALGLGEGAFMACDIAPEAQPYWALARFESGPPQEGTVDWYLSRSAERSGANQFVLDLRGAPTTGVVGEWLSEPRGMFVVGSVYSPEWGAMYASYPTSLATLFDGVAFFQTTTAARPLPLGDCPDQIYR